MVLGIVLWVIGLLIFLNIVGLFLNQYIPLWFPVLELLFFLLFLAALVLITIWMCKDTEATRKNLTVSSWLIIGSIITSEIVAVIFLTIFLKTSYVMVGTGDKDDPDNYEKQPKSWFVLGYFFFDCQ